MPNKEEEEEEEQLLLDPPKTLKRLITQSGYLGPKLGPKLGVNSLDTILISQYS